jgi:hypothetical protein
MRLVRDELEVFMHLVRGCKAALKKFKFEELTKEQFDTFSLLPALKPPGNEPPRARILQNINQDGDQVRFDDIITHAWISSTQSLTVEFSAMKTFV